MDEARYGVLHCRNNGRKGVAYVGAAISRPPRIEYNLCGQTRTTLRHVIPRERKRVEESSRVADFILRWFIIQRGGFLHSADAAVGMTISKRFYGFAHCLCNVLRRPAALIRLALGRASFPQGKLLYRAFGWYHSTARVVFARWRGAGSRLRRAKINHTPPPFVSPDHAWPPPRGLPRVPAHSRCRLSAVYRRHDFSWPR